MYYFVCIMYMYHYKCIIYVNHVLLKMTSAPPASATQVNILSSGLVATQNNVGWNGQPARALDGNTDGQWRSGYVTVITY